MTDASFSAIWINGERTRPDALHLSEKGYAIWAGATDGKLKELLGEK